MGGREAARERLMSTSCQPMARPTKRRRLQPWQWQQLTGQLGWQQSAAPQLSASIVRAGEGVRMSLGLWQRTRSASGPAAGHTGGARVGAGGVAKRGPQVYRVVSIHTKATAGAACPRGRPGCVASCWALRRGVFGGCCSASAKRSTAGSASASQLGGGGGQRWQQKNFGTGASR